MKQNISELLEQEVKRILGEEASNAAYPVMCDELLEACGEIVGELSNIAPDKKVLIYELSDLLRGENQLFRPIDAYEAGFRSEGTDCPASFMNYAKEVVLSQEAAVLFAKRDKTFFELSELLGATRGLLTEFVDYYRACNCIISKNINVFFALGFNAK